MSYIDENFLFSNETGKMLYHDYAKDLPIYDYHCHLDPKEIAEDRAYSNLTEIWLGGDHYKWRAMRMNGVPEEFVTGDGDDYEKFLHYAKTLEKAVGNPLYQWSHMELLSVFGIDRLLNQKSAKEIWEKANAKLESITTQQLIRDANVTYIGTTDDPTDDLRYHAQIAEDATIDVTVMPTFRPDTGFSPEKKGYQEWVSKLGKAAEIAITDLSSYEEALNQRIDYFHEKGCRMADHGYEDFHYIPVDRDSAQVLFKRSLEEALTAEESLQLKSYITSFLAREYAKRNWVMQMHIGALRNTNKRMFLKLGGDAGFDAPGDGLVAKELNTFLSDLDAKEQLPQVILYNLNACDNDVFASIMGNFTQENVPGKVLYGSAWWFQDQQNGIEKQLTSFANFGLLGLFLGMVTDSRSFLSYARHDYFRRTLCNLIGQWVEGHKIPKDRDILKKLVQNICYYNALRYFER